MPLPTARHSATRHLARHRAARAEKRSVPPTVANGIRSILGRKVRIISPRLSLQPTLTPI